MDSSGFSEKKKTFWSKDEAVRNIERYCAFQERCHKEVRMKLVENGIYGDLLEEIIANLISNNFLDEERFARTFARGKFRMKGWGRIKITQELKWKDVTSYSIKAGISEIDPKEYFSVLQDIITKKDRSSHFKSKFDRIKKLTDFALSKGYEYELIKEAINDEIKE